MGLFDLFRRRANLAPEDPGQLREALFAAAAGGDMAQLDTLCRARRALIATHFRAWSKVPEPMRKNRVAIQRHIDSLIAVSQAFERLWNDATLLNGLVASPEDNPLAVWEKKLNEAHALAGQFRYSEAKELLTNLLIDVRDLQTFGPPSYPALTHGALGSCLFNSGDVEGAKPHFERALHLCEEAGDAAGIHAHSGNLYDVHRYLGEPEQASEYALRRVASLRAGGHPKEAAHWERQAALVRAGEPLNRVVAVIGDEQFEIDEMPPLPVNIQINGVFVRNRPSLQWCGALTQQGRQLGSEGKYYDALEAFREAAKVDPYDPQPRYDAGATFMHLNRPAEAADEYAATDQLAPGWFQCRADRWLAEEIAAGRIEHSVFLVLRLEDVGPTAMPIAEQVEIIEQALVRFPDVAPLHLLHAKLLAAYGRESDSTKACRAGLSCVREPDVQTRLLVQLQQAEPTEAERIRLLSQAVALRETGNPLAAAFAAIVLKTLRRN